MIAVTTRASLLLDWFWQLGPWLRRVFWHPLRQLLEIFHVMPLAAALVVFGLLATDGQLREIYLSYLEDLKSEPAASIGIFAAAAVGLALVSAVLFEAHYLLSTMRINVIYSSNAKPEAGSRLRGLQRNAAIALALSPWLGVVAGLFGAKLYLAKTLAGLNPTQFLPAPNRWAIAGSVLALGVAASIYVEAEPDSQSPQRTAMALRPVVVAVVALLLADALPTDLNLPTVLGTLLIAAITAGYYAAYHWLHRMRFHVLYAHPLYRDTGVYLRQRQHLLLFLWALLPWLIVAIYFFFATPPGTGQNTWTVIPVSICVVAAVGLIVAFLLYRHRESARLFWTVVGSVAGLAVLGLIVAEFDADTIIAVYRAIGPLASMALGLLFLISIFAALAILSQRSGFPALTLVTLALVISAIFPVPIGITAAALAVLCALFGVMAAISRLGFVAAVAFLLTVPGAINYLKVQTTPSVGLHSSPQGETLQLGFERWLNQKDNTPSDAKALGCTTIATAAKSAAANADAAKYPVFVIAAEGGGIYAASAAALLLAKLQDCDPSFADHVFAISAVSGGAIGATIFAALDQSKKQAPAAAAANIDACRFRPAKKTRPDSHLSLQDEVSAIMQEDHFSPVVATIFPEILGLSFCTRPAALAASFEAAVDAQDGAAAQVLGGRFADNWQQAGKAPALVLNATWAETGFRVAFAPFQLHAIDDSLYSFDDPQMPITEKNVSLMDAAVVSARFPAILSPFAVSIDENKDEPPSGKNSAMQWNFVDGGYADSSGAATALDLYSSLLKIADQHNAELRMILLTSSHPTPEPDKIQGTKFGDTLAPMHAILSVREGLTNEAVARACDGVLQRPCPLPSESPCDVKPDQPEPKLQIVEIPNETYQLPLGWKLSRTTFNVVSWMVGAVDAAGNGRPLQATQGIGTAASDTRSQGEGVAQQEIIAKRNSCVLSAILKTLAEWRQANQRP